MTPRYFIERRGLGRNRAKVENRVAETAVLRTLAAARVADPVAEFRAIRTDLSVVDEDALRGVR